MHDFSVMHATGGHHAEWPKRDQKDLETNSTCSQTYVKAEKASLRSRPVASRVKESEREWGGKK